MTSTHHTHTTEEAQMRQGKSIITSAASVAILLGSMSLAPIGSAAAEEAKSVVEQGKQIAFNRKKGNCLACHQIEGGEMAGNIGPPLVAMKARFPDKSKLRAQIWDSTKMNPNSMMPPFGRHDILSEDEIDKVVEYIYTL
jgi:sulfur-oxidizing protein SoxX